jgi:signal transduction histidine kinase
LRAFGLRPRLLAALLLTSAVTLGVAALALLSPLEHRLRGDGESAVFNAIGAARPEFEEIKLDRATGSPQAEPLRVTAEVLRRRAGATVTILDRDLDLVFSGAGSSLNVPSYYGQASRTLNANKGIHLLVGDTLVASEPLEIGGKRYVLIVMKRLQYVASAVHVVREAFIKAAGAGLAIALLLGIGFATTLLRRLERLRDAARELERRGLDAPLPRDGGRDEIGELARAFASMQQRLLRQEETRRSFLATASHELRTPLASLDAMLELLEDDLAAEHLDLDDARERTTRAREQSARLSNLASDLLDLSRLDAEVQLRTEPVELGELCRAVAAEFELRAAQRGVALNLDRSAESAWVAADPGALARTVRILLDNALRVAPTTTSIDVETASDGTHAWVSVRDRGPGVPAAERELIFERFQRGSGTAGRSGFGLGLAIGRELVLRMGGTLALLPGPPPGEPHGACFTLTLPAVQIYAESQTT